MNNTITKEREAPFSKLYENGFFLTPLNLGADLQQKVLEEDWASVDLIIGSMCQKHGLLYETLKKISHFESIEHIVSLRKAPDEDGIWHDDGSRVLAFSLSLNLKPENIKGGALSIRKKVQANEVNG